MSAARHGPVIAGRFALSDSLGRGGMGEVYRARDLQGGRDVAVKLARGLSPAQLERFRREGEATARLRHPHVVTVHDRGVDGSQGYIVYELIEEARSLGEAMREVGLEARVRWIRDAALGLGHGHQQGILHRDVKPENLLVDGQGHLKVADYGLAKYAGNEKLTQTGTLVGTPLYMSPEQITGMHASASPATDVWALGVILFEALHDQPPFEGDSLHSLAGQISSGEVPRLPLESPLARQVDVVIRGALRTDPADRYPDGDAVAAALEDALAGRLVVKRRGWGLLAAGGVVSLAALTLLAVGALSDPPARKTPSPAPAPRPAGETPKAPASPRPDPASGTAAVAEHVRSFQHGEEGLTPGAFLGDDRVATAGQDGKLRIWSLQDGELLSTSVLDDRPPASDGPLDWSYYALLRVSGRLIAASPRRGVAIVRARAFVEVQRIKFPARVAIASPDRESFVVGGPVRQVVRFDLDGKKLAVYDGHRQQVVAVAFLPDGRLATFAGAQGMDSLAANTMRVFDAETGALLHESNLQGPFRCFAYAQDGTLFGGTTVGQVFRMDPVSGVIRSELIDPAFAATDGALMKKRASEGSVRQLFLSNDERTLYVLSRGKGGDLKRWKLADDTVVGSAKTPLEGYDSGNSSKDGRWLLLASRRGRADLWRVPE